MDDDMSNSPSEDVFRLTYRSRSRIQSDRRIEALGALFSAARAKNKKLGITGALLITDDWFVQTLEGDETAVRGLFETIRDDPRHDTVTLINSSVVDQRVFSRWAMAKVAADGEPDIPLLTGKKGIVTAAAQPTTAEQDAMLDFMRETALAGSQTV